MCGLTGLARYPDKLGVSGSRKVFVDLLAATEHRGRHATGMATTAAGGGSFVWKQAVAAREAIKTAAFGKMIDSTIHRGTQVVLGHTRFATHRNGHVDACAHPFKYGSVVGAHNGIIYNYEEVAKQFNLGPFEVDSQVIFAGLAKLDDPQTLFDALDGYWALTWMDRGKLYVCRTDDAPLTMAYSGKHRTLFWNSERSALLSTLGRHGLDNLKVWEPTVNTLYEYDPSQFTEEATTPTKRKLTFAARKKREGRFNSAKPTLITSSTPMETVYRGSLDDDQYDAWQKRQSHWTQRPPSTPPTTKIIGRPQGVSLIDVANDIVELRTNIDQMMERMEYLMGKVEDLRAEQDYLFTVVDEHGMLTDDEPEPEPPFLPAKGEPTKERVLLPPVRVCVECGQGDADGDGALLPVADGTFVHAECVMADATGSSH